MLCWCGNQRLRVQSGPKRSELTHVSTELSHESSDTHLFIAGHTAISYPHITLLRLQGLTTASFALVRFESRARTYLIDSPALTAAAATAAHFLALASASQPPWASSRVHCHHHRSHFKTQCRHQIARRSIMSQSIHSRFPACAGGRVGLTAGSLGVLKVRLCALKCCF